MPMLAAKIAVSGTDNGNHHHRVRSHGEQTVHPADHVNAGSDHGGGMDQRGDRSRTFHGIRQPGVKGNLGRLAGSAKEEAEGDDRHDQAAVTEQVTVLGDLDEIQGPDAVLFADGPEERNSPSRKPKSPTRLTTKAFLAASPAALLMKVIPDKEIRTEAHAFPTDEHDQGVVAQNQHQHGEAEQVRGRRSTGRNLPLHACSRWSRGE